MSNQPPLTHEQLEDIREALIAIAKQVDDSGPSGPLIDLTIQTVVKLLLWFRGIPVSEPEPEPEPDPVQQIADLLLGAATAAEYDSPEEAILDAAYRYTQKRPDWFGGDASCLSCKTVKGDHRRILSEAALHAEYYPAAKNLLLAAREVAQTHSHLFEKGEDE